MPREDYEERKAARIDRLHERSLKASEDSASFWAESKRMADVIPFGQPILVGHHSEKRDRNYRDKIWNKGRKAVDLGNKADELASRAASAESNDAISADDPNGVEKLKAKLAAEKEIHEANKAANRKLRKAKIAVSEISNDKLIEAGIENARVRANLLSLARVSCMYGEYVKIPGYKLSNRNANMKRMESRIKELEASADEVDAKFERNGFEVVYDVDDNRVKLMFPGKPSAEIRAICNRNGFRWSPRAGAWQRLLNGNGKAAAKWAADEIEKLEN